MRTAEYRPGMTGQEIFAFVNGDDITLAKATAERAWKEFEAYREELAELRSSEVSQAQFQRLEELALAHEKARHHLKLTERLRNRLGDFAADSWFQAIAKAPNSPLEAKAFTGSVYAVPPAWDGTVVELARRRRFVTDVLPIFPIDGDQYTTFVQTVRTNAAAEVAAGGLKPTTVVTYERQDDRTRVVAHISEPVDRFLVSDATSLRDFLASELRLGVLLRIDSQVLNGNGTGENIRGILNTSGILTQALGADSRSDAIHKAITVLVKQEIEPNLIFLNPDDAEQLFLEKDANGQYIYGPPTQPFSNATIWGLEVVVTNGMPAGTGLVGDRNQARIYSADETIVEFSDQDNDLFQRNQIRGRAEARVNVAVVRPKGWCTVTGI